MSTIPQSTTPRTDAAVRLTIGAGFNMIYPSFARELENELAEMSSIAEKWEDDALRYARNAEYWQTRAEKAEAELARLRAENDEMRVQIEANKRKGGGCQCADDEACAHVRRAERAEIEAQLWHNRFASILWSGALDKHTGEDFQKWEAEFKAEQNALIARAEKAEVNVEQLTKHCSALEVEVAVLSEGLSEDHAIYIAKARAEKAEAELKQLINAKVSI